VCVSERECVCDAFSLSNVCVGCVCVCVCVHAWVSGWHVSVCVLCVHVSIFTVCVCVCVCVYLEGREEYADTSTSHVHPKTCVLMSQMGLGSGGESPSFSSVVRRGRGGGHAIGRGATALLPENGNN
jgi:hypothetical protein